MLMSAPISEKSIYCRPIYPKSALRNASQRWWLGLEGFDENPGGSEFAETPRLDAHAVASKVVNPGAGAWCEGTG